MKHWIKNSLIVGSLLLPAFSFGQEIEMDTSIMHVKHIDAVHIPLCLIVMPPVPLDGLYKEDIETINPDDVAGLVSKIPGTTIRSYGGLGGLKTVSMRGLGGQHTAVIVDGFEVTNAQAGQMNLGQLQAEGLESVTSGLILPFDALQPISSNFAGNNLQFRTFLGRSNNQRFRMKSSVRYGSFMRREVYSQGEKSVGRWNFGAFGKYRDANGVYPYHFLNGSTETAGLRGNNDYQDMHFGAKVERILGDKRNKRLRLMYRSSLIDQGLPGAVILYNESADERMSTQDHRIMLDFKQFKYNSNFRTYVNAGVNDMEYWDPTYLNALGYVRDQFRNFQLDGGYVHFRELEKIKLKWGAEQKVETLRSNRTAFGQPLRASTFALFGAQKEWNRFYFEGIAGGQFVHDQNAEGNNEHFQFTPNALVRYTIAKAKRITTELLYKRNFRLPSFNELYFGEVGNRNLKPEIAHQLNLGFDWRIKKESYYGWHWVLHSQGYYNRVHNKIVAIPTKNLFVWSMQNVAEAAVYGAIGESRVIRRFSDKLRIELLANYTWQRVIDITPDAITYGHQVAYAPEHTINADFMAAYKGTSLRVSNNFVSGRYALNQNVPANYLDPFWTMDLALGYKYTINDKHKIGVQLNVRNLTDVSYAFIRSYVMPGRHYLLTLNYEIL